MKVLSLFDGMSVGMQALKNLGIGVERYYASEIDAHASKVSERNHSEILRLGDITKWKEWGLDFSEIDLVLAGSPCQGFSFAGKRLAFDDHRSALFFVFLDILNAVRAANPSVKFLLENVKMAKKHQEVVSGALGVDPVEINSALVSAQNRRRLYWCNWQVTQPTDEGILLADVLESGVTDRDKSYCIVANYWKGTNVEQYIKKARRQIVFTEICAEEVKRIRRDFKENTLIEEKLSYRKLTPIECERLQTLPDGYTEGVSNTQRYKMLGNGWTCKVIEHVLKQARL